MRPRSQRHRFVITQIGQRGQIEALGQIGQGAFGSGGKASEIEGEPIAQQFQPVLLAAPERFGMERVSRVGVGVVADADRRTARYKRPDRIPIRPLATAKQQMQFSIMGTLRL